MHNEADPEMQTSEDLESGQTAVSCYLASMLAIANAGAEICPSIGEAFQTNVVRLRQRTAFSPSKESLTGSLLALEADLRTFTRRTSDYHRQRAGDTGALLDTVLQALDTLETRDQVCRDRLALTIHQMAAAESNAEELAEVARQQLTSLKKFVDLLSADSIEVFDHLRGEVRAIEERLLQGVGANSMDALTALVSRTELEQQIRERIEGGRIFSLLLFDIRNLSSINARFGEEGGNQLLRQFAGRLSAQVRPLDAVARWGGDEFAVIFECPAETAEPRAKQIAQWVSGRYPISTQGRDWKPEIEASVVVVEHRQGEQPAEFVARAAAALPEHGSAAETPARINEFSPESWKLRTL